MSFINKFDFAPAEWLPLQDREMLDRVCMMDIREHQGRIYEHPDFEMKVVHDVHNYFVTDLFHKIYMSDVQNQKLVMILPSPENAVFISLAENINKFQVSCRNVHVFFLYEYANENGDVAPWQSPYSRSGHFMRYFYQRVEEHLRMPMENIHFWTKENTETYSDELAALGGADVAYTALSWTGLKSLLPLVGSCLAVVGYWCTDPRLLRKFNFAGVSLWAIYGILAFSVPTIVGNLISMTTIILTELRLRRQKEDFS